MNVLAGSALLVVAAVVGESFFPGRNAYHYGWFNAALIGLTIVAAAAGRRALTDARTPRSRVAVGAIVVGCALAGLAGAANGLFAPDDRTVVGAPGERTRVDDLGGTIDFPLVDAGDPRAASSFGVVVVLDRPGRRPLPIGQRGRNAGSFVVRSAPRQVVYVEARDPQGGRLTITQPSGSSFLSPVLMMQQNQTIAGLSLPFDSFAVPAMHRVVKAVLFSAAEASTLRGLAGGVPAPAVLFAVDDANDRPLPHAIAVARDGATVAAGGLSLQAIVLSYPAVDVMPVPAPLAVAFGALLVVAGLVAKGGKERDAGRS
ncbi:MAG TPA: hypothetical protein VGF86_10065 [Candidatus Tumulicola sp.]|jgi:hypothetical protein